MERKYATMESGYLAVKAYLTNSNEYKELRQIKERYKEVRSESRADACRWKRSTANM